MEKYLWEALSFAQKSYEFKIFEACLGFREGVPVFTEDPTTE